MVSVRNAVSPGRGRAGMTSGACARSMVWMPESIDRSIGSRSEPPRPLTIFGPATFLDALLRLVLEVLPFFLLTAFFCLGMVLLQQRRDGVQEFLDLDRFIQYRNIIGFCVLSSLW